jgi:hypothetical protein
MKKLFELKTKKDCKDCLWFVDADPDSYGFDKPWCNCDKNVFYRLFSRKCKSKRSKPEKMPAIISF